MLLSSCIFKIKTNVQCKQTRKNQREISITWLLWSRKKLEILFMGFRSSFNVVFKTEIKKLFECLTNVGLAEGQTHCFHSCIKVKFLCFSRFNLAGTVTNSVSGRLT